MGYKFFNMIFLTWGMRDKALLKGMTPIFVACQKKHLSQGEDATEAER
jgi:hypothetical protein